MRLFPAVALGFVTVLILAVTLAPASGQIGYLPVTCIFCGEHATSDALSNVILFLPLGFTLAWWRPGSNAWRFGPALSLGIELTQRFIAGRDASVGDVLTNTLGTLLGWIAWRYVAAGAVRPAPRAWPWAAAAFAAIVAVTMWLMQPAPTHATYYGMWTPVLGQFQWYRGRVLDARLGADRLGGSGDLIDPAAVRRFVTGTAPLHARFIAGRRTVALAPLVAVFDEDKEEILVLGMDREALVLRFRRHTGGWQLDGPDTRFENVVPAWAPGDTVTLSIARTARATCLTQRDQTRCVSGVTPGVGWSLVLYPESLPKKIRAALNLLWPLGLMALLGWCAGTARTGLAGGVVALAALWFIPPLLGAAPSPPAELAAAILGLAPGVALRRVTARQRQPATMPATTATQRSMRSYDAANTGRG